MAKRRKTHRKHHRRSHRRGMSGFGSKSMTGAIMDVAATVGGAVAASFVETKLLANFMTDKPAIKHGVIMAAGIVGEGMIKNPLLKNVAKGMAVAGGLNLAKTLVPAIGAIAEGDVTSLMEDITLGEIAGTEPVTIGENVTIGDMETLSMVEDITI